MSEEEDIFGGVDMGAPTPTAEVINTEEFKDDIPATSDEVEEEPVKRGRPKKEEEFDSELYTKLMYRVIKRIEKINNITFQSEIKDLCSEIGHDLELIHHTVKR
jgi:hypothetical protein